MALAVLLGFFGAAERALAQGLPRGLLAPGDAAVTGFSGAIEPRQTPPTAIPAIQTYIDVNGASLRIVDLQHMGGEPRGQLVNAPKPFSVTAAQIGQVFGVTLDNVTPPNIYVAATSAFGLHVVRTAPNGQVFHAANGAPNTRFMPGTWGSAVSNGGPGSIWKIDGVTGAVSLFANVVLDGVPNSGPALGGLVFDPDSNSLFAADRDTGMIHRFGMNGAELGRYDHGVQGRIAQNLPPVPFDPAKRLNIQSQDFRSANIATWAYAPPERRVFGLGIYQGRLYYAVAAGLQIWSVSLGPDGSFGNDATIEINARFGFGPSEISKIAFDDEGRMLLAERPAPTGNFDMRALAVEGIGRVLRYTLIDTQPGARRIWQPIPDEYAIGMPGGFRNGNGGVAIGFDYDRKGILDRNTCGGFLWSTGERLRKTSGPGSVVRVSLPLPENVDGLQGNYLWLARPNNTPPLRSYFVDYDDRFDGAAARGHMGDVTIWRACMPLVRGGWMLPGWMSGWAPFGYVSGPPKIQPPPKLECPADQQKPGVQCCPAGTSLDASRQCRPWCPSGATDKKSQNLCWLGFDPVSVDFNDPGKARCLGGSVPVPGQPGGGCLLHSPVVNAPVCKIGFTKKNMPGIGTICQPVPGQGSCPAGQQVSPIDNKCHAFCAGGAWPTTQCCAPGSALSVTGKCCPAGSTPDPKSGLCAPPPTVACNPANGPCPPTLITCDPAKGPCPPTLTTCDPAKGPCPPTFTTCTGPVSNDGTCCANGSTPNNVGGGCCPAGKAASASGLCQATICLPPSKSVGGMCCSADDLKPGGKCALAVCGTGLLPVDASNYCCDADKVYTNGSGVKACCSNGTVKNGQCTPSATPLIPGCQVGYSSAGDGSCCQSAQLTSNKVCCPVGQTPGGPNNSQCQAILVGPPSVSDGGPSVTVNPPTGGQCCAPGLIPVASGACCARNQVTSTGLCCPADQQPDPRNRSTCVQIQSCGLRHTMIDGACCPNANVYNNASGRQQCCPQLVNQAGQCVIPDVHIELKCETGSTRVADGSCCPNRSLSTDGRTCRPDHNKPPVFVIPKVLPACAPGQVRNDAGRCVVVRPLPPTTRPPLAQPKPARPKPLRPPAAKSKPHRGVDNK